MSYCHYPAKYTFRSRIQFPVFTTLHICPVNSFSSSDPHILILTLSPVPALWEAPPVSSSLGYPLPFRILPPYHPYTLPVSPGGLGRRYEMGEEEEQHSPKQRSSTIPLMTPLTLVKDDPPETHLTCHDPEYDPSSIMVNNHITIGQQLSSTLCPPTGRHMISPQVM